MSKASLKIEWEKTGLIPTSGLQLWYQCKPGEAANGLAPDYSGNARHAAAASNPPVIVPDIVNGQPGWYFNGSRNPLVFNMPSGTMPIQQIFVLGAAEGAAFDEYRGLVNGTSTVDWLVSENAGTEFFSPGGLWDFKKSGLALSDASIQAPMGLVPEVMEASYQTGPLSMAGVMIGEHYVSSARKWKGYFIELLAYSSIQTGRELERIYLYFNLKFAQHKRGLPFYFPSDDILPMRRRRFYAEPPDKKKIVDSYEFEDGGRTFNTISDTAIRRWEYDYRLVNRGASVDPQEVAIFDEFWAQAGVHVPFIFRDKWGTEWPNVRVEDYDRTHRDYKPWEQDVRFKLIKYP